MYNILTIIGARPQIIKAAAISRTLNNYYNSSISEIILHTGQHFDNNMSDIFINQLNIPKPAYNLSVNSGLLGERIANIIIGIEKAIQKDKPNGILVYGDTDSTMAASIAAVKNAIPLFHVEAGLRSFNKNMPEEINRIFCDHASTLLFSPTYAGMNNLINEGFNNNNEPPYSINNPGIFHTGDIMFDNSMYFSKIANSQSSILNDYSLQPNNFVLVTIHRDFNTDNVKRLENILIGINKIVNTFGTTVFLPIHPRTKKVLYNNSNVAAFNNIINNDNVIISEPVSFFDMINLESNCSLVITDSGGVQKEAFFFKKPCVILRPETEWIELVENGNAAIANDDINKIFTLYEYFISNASKLDYPNIYGDGNAAEKICKIISDTIYTKLKL